MSDDEAGDSPAVLREPDPKSLDALFSTDPETLTDAELDRIIAKLREQREVWRQQEIAGKVRPTKAATAKPTLNLNDLDDLA